MKIMILYFLFLVAASRAEFLNEGSELKGLPAPIVKKMTIVEPHGYELEWEPVKTNEPIEGYTVKMWEYPKYEKVFTLETVNGKKELVEKLVPYKLGVALQNSLPIFEPKEVITVKPNQFRVKSNNLERGLTYEFRVQAFNDKENGPFSKPVQWKLP